MSQPACPSCGRPVGTVTSTRCMSCGASLFARRPAGRRIGRTAWLALALAGVLAAAVGVTALTRSSPTAAAPVAIAAPAVEPAPTVEVAAAKPERRKGDVEELTALRLRVAQLEGSRLYVSAEVYNPTDEVIGGNVIVYAFEGPDMRPVISIPLEIPPHQWAGGRDEAWGIALAGNQRFEAVWAGD